MHISEISSSPPASLFAAELSMNAGQRCFMHTHACTEIIWYRGCKGWLPQGEKRLRYRCGDIAIYQPGLVHGDECEKEGTQVCLGITGMRAEELPPGVWHADEDTLRACAQLRHELGRHDDGRQARLNLLGGLVVLELQRQLAAQSPATPPLPPHVSAARRIFDTRFQKPLSIAGVAKELTINPDYLRQLFLKHTGETPSHYLIRKRLECARDLLRLNQESTRQIAARAGIENPYYFSRLFRARYGLTPTEYRNRYRRAKT